MSTFLNFVICISWGNAKPDNNIQHTTNSTQLSGDHELGGII